MILVGSAPVNPKETKRAPGLVTGLTAKKNLTLIEDGSAPVLAVDANEAAFMEKFGDYVKGPGGFLVKNRKQNGDNGSTQELLWASDIPGDLHRDRLLKCIQDGSVEEFRRESLRHGSTGPSFAKFAENHKKQLLFLWEDYYEDLNDEDLMEKLLSCTQAQIVGLSGQRAPSLKSQRFQATSGTLPYKSQESDSTEAEIAGFAGLSDIFFHKRNGKVVCVTEQKYRALPRNERGKFLTKDAALSQVFNGLISNRCLTLLIRRNHFGGLWLEEDPTYKPDGADAPEKRFILKKFPPGDTLLNLDFTKEAVRDKDFVNDQMPPEEKLRYQNSVRENRLLLLEILFNVISSTWYPPEDAQNFGGNINVGNINRSTDTDTDSEKDERDESPTDKGDISDKSPSHKRHKKDQRAQIDLAEELLKCRKSEDVLIKTDRGDLLVTGHTFENIPPDVLEVLMEMRYDREKEDEEKDDEEEDEKHEDEEDRSM